MQNVKATKRFLGLLIACVMLLSQTIVFAAPGDMAVSQELVTKTTVDLVTVTADLGENPDLSQLEWTFGGKPLDEWKTMENREETNISFISFENEPEIADGKVVATICFGYGYSMEGEPTNDPAGTWSDLNTVIDNVGMQTLAVTDKSSGVSASFELEYRPYEGFMLYDEIKGEIDAVLAAKTNGVYTEYQVIGYSGQGRPMHFVILAKDRAVLDNYLEILPDMLDNPAKYQATLQDGGDLGPVPVFVNNIHPNEHPGIDVQLQVLKELTTKTEITYDTYLQDLPFADVNESGELAHTEVGADSSEVTINVDELLNQVFFLFNFTENPDGRYLNTRANARGFDVNRDNVTQLQPESKVVTEQVAKWSPAVFLDLHGFVDAFLFEPCTPPHDPNYEYDLLMRHGLPHAHGMGKAAIANTAYETYLIAQEGEPNWDDGAGNYTATYALHHGAMGSTIEMPDSNYESLLALKYAILESARYVADNYADVVNTQLEYYRRGVEGLDVAESVDPWLVNKDNVSIGRQRVQAQATYPGSYLENVSFFPEYYVLPVGDEQKNVNEVVRIVEYMIRNGVKVSKLSADTAAGGITYEAGSYVIDMRQAKRGLANTALYKGIDLRSWDEGTTLASGLQYEEIQMYAEIVTNFPALRGFTCLPIYYVGAFEGNLEPVAAAPAPVTVLPDTADVLIHNNDLDAVRAVNRMLAAGKPVYVTDDGFIAATMDLKAASAGLSVSASACETVTGKMLKLPKVYTEELTVKSTLGDLGFAIADDKSEADIIVDGSGILTAEDLGSIPYVGYGKYALMTLSELPGFSMDAVLNENADYEAVVNINIKGGLPATSGYNGADYGYLSTGAIINQAPEGAAILAETADNAFVAGWFPQAEQLNNTVFGFEKTVDGANVTFFTGDILRKEYNQNLFRLVTNAIYEAAAE